MIRGNADSLIAKAMRDSLIPTEGHFGSIAMIEDEMVAMEEAEKLRAVSAEVVEEVGDAKEARSSSSWKRLQKRLGRVETEKKKKKIEAQHSNIDNE